MSPLVTVVGMVTYLWRESLNEDSNKEIEEDVVTERHESDEIEGSPGWSPRHAVIENHVPIFLGQDLVEEKATIRKKKGLEQVHIIM